MPTASKGLKDRTLGIVLLKDRNDPVEIGNVHEAHLPRLESYTTQGIKFELRKEKYLSIADPDAFLVLRVDNQQTSM